MMYSEKSTAWTMHVQVHVANERDSKTSGRGWRAEQEDEGYQTLKKGGKGEKGEMQERRED